MIRRSEPNINVLFLQEGPQGWLLGGIMTIEHQLDFDVAMGVIGSQDLPVTDPKRQRAWERVLPGQAGHVDDLKYWSGLHYEVAPPNGMIISVKIHSSDQSKVLEAALALAQFLKLPIRV